MPNMNVILTRPEKQSLDFFRQLSEKNYAPHHFPVFEIAALESIAAKGVLDDVLRRLSEFSLVVFVSPNAIDAVFEQLAQLGLTWPKQLAIGVMGAASRSTLHTHGIAAQQHHIFSPTNQERTDSETLFEVLPLDDLRGKSVLIVRGESGREFLREALLERGVEVAQVVAYRRVIPNFDQEKQRQLMAFLNQQNTWVITSSESLKTLLQWCGQLDFQSDVSSGEHAFVNKMRQQNLFVPHFRIEQCARGLGFVSITLTASGDEKLLLALQSQL
ncbi:MAG: uroporphyrinogen-III synthase [Undibacterium sp.]|nr:uroporphyrinogen-III synthase [Undibacterium sp.]